MLEQATKVYGCVENLIARQRHRASIVSVSYRGEGQLATYPRIRRNLRSIPFCFRNIACHRLAQLRVHLICDRHHARQQNAEIDGR